MTTTEGQNKQRNADKNVTLRQIASSLRHASIWLLLFSLAINLLILASPIYMMQIFDRVLSSGRMETLLFLTIIAAVAVLFMGAIEMVRGKFLQRVGRWLELRLSRETIEATLRAKLVGAADGAQPLRDLAAVRTTLASPGINALFDAPGRRSLSLSSWHCIRGSGLSPSALQQSFLSWR